MPVAVTALSESGSVGWVKYVCPLWFTQPVGGGHWVCRVLSCTLITEIVSSPRFMTKSRLLSELATAYTGHIPRGMFEETVNEESSIPSADPIGWDVGAVLHSMPIGLAMFWL